MAKCPTCQVENNFTVVKRDNGRLKCESCGNITSDEFTNKTFGLIVTEEPKGVAYQNEFDTSLFTSWYCLKKFKDYDLMKSHDSKYHRDGDLQLGMMPVGFKFESPVCGNEDVISINSS